MTGKEDLRDSHLSQIRTRPGEAEVAELLQEAARQYEECMRIADLADISAGSEIGYPRYAWDNPIGLHADRTGMKHQTSKAAGMVDV